MLYSLLIVSQSLLIDTIENIDFYKTKMRIWRENIFVRYFSIINLKLIN